MTDPAYEDASQALWDKTEADWNVEVYHTLTEPVCAYVNLYSDDESLPSVKGFIGTSDVNESIRMACEYILETLEKK